MQIELLSNSIDIGKYLKNVNVDSGGVAILSLKALHYIIYIRELHVGAANILKQDALSIGADLGVPRGTVVAKTPYVDCILIATARQLQTLSRKELAQPFGLKEVAYKLQEILKVKKPSHAEVMGVINANDDSFFSASRFKEKSAIEAIERMIEEGDKEAIEQAHAMLNEIQHLSAVDRERLFGFLEGTGKMILVEPGYLLTEESKMPGLDGHKMSKSYNNTITMRESEESVAKKIKSMPTDPARARRTDPGDPAKCPVWQLHLVYSNDACKEWVQQGCRSAGIGCIECKQPVIDGILREQAPMRERAQMYLDDTTLVKNIIADGCEKARDLARETMRDVREAMGLEYH